MKKVFKILKKAWLPFLTVVLFGLISSTTFAAHTLTDVLVDDGEAITITLDTNDMIRMDDGGTGDCVAYVTTAELTAGTYTPTELAAEMTTKMTAALTGTATVVYDYETRKFTISGNEDDDICWMEGAEGVAATLGYTANDMDISGADAVSDTAQDIGDRIYTTSTVGSDSILLEIDLVFAWGTNETLDNVLLDPPDGWSIRGWNLFDTAAADAADATDTPDMDENAGDSAGCADPQSTTAVATCDDELPGVNGMPAAGGTLSLALETSVTNTQTLVLQVWLDTTTTAAVSDTWTLTTTDSAAATVDTTFKVVAGDADDIAFEIYEASDPLDGDISQVHDDAETVYLYNDDEAGFDITDFSVVDQALSGGLALFENGTAFTGTVADAGGFDYIVTGADESKVGADTNYGYTAVTAVKAIVVADTTDPDISAVTVNNTGGKNVITFTLTEPLVHASLIGADADMSIASSATFGDTTSTSTGLVFAGIGEWVDTDGQPNTTNQTLANTVVLDKALTSLAVTVNGETTASLIYYFTNIVAGVAADATNDDFTPAGTQIADAAANTTDTTAVGTGAITVTAGWDVTPLSTATGFEKSGVTPTEDYFAWSAITDPGDFSTYLLLYDTSTITEATGASQWDGTDDATLTTVTTATTSVTGLSAGTTYYERLGTVDTEGNIALSTEISSSAGSGGGGSIDTTGPGAPTNFAVSVNEDLEVDITWTDPTDDDILEIKILKSEDGTNFFQTTLLVAGTETYTDTYVIEGDTYSYKIVGVDANGNIGAETNVIELTVVEGAEEVAEEVEPVAGEEAADEEEPVDEEETVAEGEATIGVLFSDTDGHWGEAEIEAMAEIDIAEGDPEGTFRPDGELNRAEAAALLFRVLGYVEPSAPDTAPFPDVAIGEWYAGYVSSMKDLELIHGYGDGLYRPGQNINRAEFVKIALGAYYTVNDDEEIRAEMDALMEGDKTNVYADLADDWYTPYVTTATEMGFVQGFACGESTRCFGATNNITRVEATVILYNMFYEILTAEVEAEVTYDCTEDLYDCSDYTTQAEAQAVYDYCMAEVETDVHVLDADENALACEELE